MSTVEEPSGSLHTLSANSDNSSLRLCMRHSYIIDYDMTDSQLRRSITPILKLGNCLCRFHFAWCAAQYYSVGFRDAICFKIHIQACHSVAWEGKI